MNAQSIINTIESMTSEAPFNSHLWGIGSDAVSITRVSDSEFRAEITIVETIERQIRICGDEYRTVQDTVDHVAVMNVDMNEAMSIVVSLISA